MHKLTGRVTWTSSLVELDDWTLCEQSIVCVKLLLWGIWTRSGSSKCRRPRTGLSIGLVYPDPGNLWAHSPLFQDLSIYAQPRALRTVIYSFPPSNERGKHCSPFLSLDYLHFPLFILQLLFLSSSPFHFLCLTTNSLLSPLHPLHLSFHFSSSNYPSFSSMFLLTFLKGISGA